MQQLGQLLGSARVQAEEFNSLLDGAPRVAKAVADGLTEAGGSVSRLKELINDGKVSNKQFFDAFLGQIPKIQAEFDKAVPTIARSLATLDNAMGKLIGEANKAPRHHHAGARPDGDGKQSGVRRFPSRCKWPWRWAPLPPPGWFRGDGRSYPRHR